MDINAEVSTQSLIDALLSDLDKKITPCIKNEKKEEETQNAMPDSTTNTEKNNANPFHCGDDVLVPNKDGRYYLGTIIELSTNNDNDSCEVGTGVARCLVKFGDGTHSWAPVSTLKLLSAPPADDGRIMCVVCKRREGPASGSATNAIVACDMCGRGYHAKCHVPPVEAWISGASWHCKRCVEQRYRVAAAENRALKRSDLFRLKGGQQRRHQQELTPPCDMISTASSTTSSTTSDTSQDQEEAHCYCGEKSDWLAQMLLCCRCSKWFHQRCVSSLQYPLYAGDKLYIFGCSNCNGGKEYLRRLELCWLDLAHLALYNLTAYNAPNYFDLDSVIMPYIMDNWHALQLPEKMWRTPVKERREKILTALTSSRKRFKCGREMKKRATIWGLRMRCPPTAPVHLAALHQVKPGEPLTDALVRLHAPRLRFLPRAPPAATSHLDSSQPSSSNIDKSSYKFHNQQMIVPVDGHWLNLMMGKRFHENLNSNSNSENDSTSSYESIKPNETDDRPTTSVHSLSRRKSNTKEDNLENWAQTNKGGEATGLLISDTPPPDEKPVVTCSETLIKSKDNVEDKPSTSEKINHINTYSQRIATMNLELSKLSTKNIIEHSKIMSLQHMDRLPACNNFSYEMDSSGDETTNRGALDAIIPPLKDFRGKNNPFLMKNSYSSSINLYNKLKGKQNFHSRYSLPGQLNPAGATVRPMKRKLSEKDLVIGPNGEVKRKKFRRPRKYLQNLQLNKSCPLPDTEIGSVIPNHKKNGKLAPSSHGRRLRQRQEKNYYENSRRNATNSANTVTVNNSVKSLQLSPHKVNSSALVESETMELSDLKSSVQAYFRAGQTLRVLARRRSLPGAPGTAPSGQPTTSYLIQWDNCSS